MSPSRWMVCAALVAAGCGGGTRACKSHTILATVHFDGAALGSDELSVVVSVGAGAGRLSTVKHPPGTAKGTLEIDFPSEYPAGQSVGIAMTATQNGAVVAATSTTVPLTGACADVTIELGLVDDGAVGSDGALGDGAPNSDGSVDGGGGDGGPVTPDAFVDLSVPPQCSNKIQDGDETDIDCGGSVCPKCGLHQGCNNYNDCTTATCDGTRHCAVCVPSGPESCFDSVDNDCNGLVDCADPACAGGIAPIAACIPAAPGFTFATFGAAPSPCPANYATDDGTMYSGLANGGSCSGCTCGAASGCTGTVSTYDSACNGTFTPMVSVDGCTALPALMPNTSLVTISSGQGTVSCPPSGSPLAAPAYATSAHVCTTAQTAGGGCATGQVCVPFAKNQCALVNGAAATCPSGYNQNRGVWYTSYSDPRTCAACSCTVNQPCSSSVQQVTLFTDFSCAVTTNEVNIAVTESQCPLSATAANYQTARFVYAPSSCTPTSAATGTVTGTSPMTLCCEYPFTQQASGATANELWSMWGSGPSNIYTVGGAPVTIRHSTDGVNWTAQASGLATADMLTSVWGSGAGDIYAVSYNGNIIHSTGNGTWTKQATAPNELRSIWGSGPNDIYAVGGDATGQSTTPTLIMHSTGNGIWTTQTSPVAGQAAFSTACGARAPATSTRSATARRCCTRRATALGPR